jgi:3-methyladenine DNA glycosylase/8-oxoguanine DNA glycosylase/3-methyladenine DNA glycosylase AlkD
MPKIRTKFFDYGEEAVACLKAADPVLGAAMDRLGRVEREVIPDLFQALVFAIIGQQVSAKAAATVWSRLQENLDGITPEGLSTASMQEIQKCGMTLHKAGYIIDIAKMAADGSLDFEELRRLPDNQVIERLSSLRGIGAWTAEMLLLNSMERPDIVSRGDMAIIRGMMKLYGLQEITKEQFEECRRRYSPFGSVASIYLWRLSFLRVAEERKIDLEADEIRKQIFGLADEEYRKFQSALCPGTDNIVGVRVPKLRKLAKEIARGDWRSYLDGAESEYFEEVMLQGMVIGYADAPAEEKLSLAACFVPKIDNWAVCDSFCTGLKFTKENMKSVWESLQPYLSSSEEFEIRFGIVMLLTYFVEDSYIDRMLELLQGIRHEGYYVKMAAAWAVSICYVRFPEKTEAFLMDNKLDDFTFNKSLQKITESLRVDADTKTKIRSMKRR